jgi:hypothetical protein
MFNKSYKSVFLPVHDIILNQYKGFVLDGEMLPDLNENDVYYILKNYSLNSDGQFFRSALTYTLLVLLFPIILVLAVYCAWKDDDIIIELFKNRIVSFYVFLFRDKDKIEYKRIRTKLKGDYYEEDAPSFFNKCKEQFTYVYLYSYLPLSQVELDKIESLIEAGWVKGYQIINQLSDLSDLCVNEQVSIHNSIMVIRDYNEHEEAIKLGFVHKGIQRNIEIWIHGSKNHSHEMEWNGFFCLDSLKFKIKHYIKAKNSLYLDNKTVIFIDENGDEVLNRYILKNYQSINRKFKKRGMNFIYFPALKAGFQNPPDIIFNSLKYRIPTLHYLSDIEIKELIQVFFNQITEESFYKLLVDPLQLPYFQSPCFLRSIYDGYGDTENLFTYKLLTYTNEPDLDLLFQGYFQQLYIPDGRHNVYKKSPKPKKYDSDVFFGKDGFKENKAFRNQIDQLKTQGNYTLLAEAVLYMLSSIQNEKPELYKKITPYIEKQNLLASPNSLSPLYIDKDFRLFLPLFGNIEIKMHSLPKVVYILFLKHPEGIRFKELYTYKQELLELYYQISPKSDLKTMKKSIDDLIDMTNPSLNQKCARIRQAFRLCLEEHLASYYYIQGNNGEAKSIQLPENLIQFER